MKRSGSSGLPTISVFGLGKLGSVVAACHASKGYRVIGVDVEDEAVEACRRGTAPVVEPGLQELFSDCRSRLTATTDAHKAVLESDVTMLIVPTPSEAGGGFSLSYVLQACEEIGKAIALKDAYHLVVLKSTVMPGDSEARIVPVIERASGRQAGSGFGYCYNPEFIALGSVIRNIYQPDLVLIGESDEGAGDLLSTIYGQILERDDAPIARMSYANAELAKLSLNSFVTVKITFANLLARLCERLPGGDADIVAGAIGLDSRIGPKYLKSGLGFGGPCFPRDNKAILALARRLGSSFPLAESTDAVNAEISLRVSDLLEPHLESGSTIALLGLSYKPSTPVVEESHAILLAEDFLRRGYRVVVYDPQAMNSARSRLGETVDYARSVEECVSEADAVVIGTAWPQFRDITGIDQVRMRSPVIMDCWSIIDDPDYTGPVLRLGRWRD